MQVASGQRAARTAMEDPLPNVRLGDTRTPEQIVKEGRELVQEAVNVLLQTPPQMSISKRCRQNATAIQPTPNFLSLLHCCP